MSYVDEMLENRASSTTAAEQLFVVKRGKFPGNIFVFVEGEDDVAFYKYVLPASVAKCSVENMNFIRCGSKATVVRLARRLPSIYPEVDQLTFLADRDFGDVIGREVLGERLWLTDDYSIESYLLTETVVSHIWIHSLAGEYGDDRRLKLIDYLNAQLVRLWKLTGAFHVAVAFCQDCGENISFSDLQVPPSFSPDWVDDLGVGEWLAGCCA